MLHSRNELINIKMYNTEFWVKYFFRVMHIGSVTALGGRIIYDYLWPDTSELT